MASPPGSRTMPKCIARWVNAWRVPATQCRAGKNRCKKRKANNSASPPKEPQPMPHINLPDGIPGILGPMAFSPQTAAPLNALAEALLRAPNSLTQGEREMIATYVSSENDCYFCQTVHGAAAAHYLGDNEPLIREIKRNFETSPISDKQKALLAIAGKVQKGGKHVTTEDIE